MMLIQKYVSREQRIKSKNIFVTSKQCTIIIAANLPHICQKSPWLVQVIFESFAHITPSYDNRRTLLDFIKKFNC